MKILIGTTNYSKRQRFQELLSDINAQFITLDDCDIEQEPEEYGKTPEENARIKAVFYGKYHDPVICNDSGLFFNELSLEDDRQPGLNIRTPQKKHRLSDDEMIEYYRELIHSLGGRVEAYYLDGVAVYRNGQVYSFMDLQYSLKRSFYMTDHVSEKRHTGWPLDSLSVDKKTGIYFADRKDSEEEDNILRGEYRNLLRNFLIGALGL